MVCKTIPGGGSCYEAPDTPWRYRADDKEPDQGLAAVCFPWQQYTAVVATLRRRAGPNMDLLGPAGAIPESALRAVRCDLCPSQDSMFFPNRSMTGTGKASLLVRGRVCALGCTARGGCSWQM